VRGLAYFFGARNSELAQLGAVHAKPVAVQRPDRSAREPMKKRRLYSNLDLFFQWSRATAQRATAFGGALRREQRVPRGALRERDRPVTPELSNVN
jgi:hypothetical protein